jgi:antitoxin (DNA-binding transcriptional repressor) of toxin-antitoxin stability system
MATIVAILEAEMEEIGVRELKDHATQILRKVREEGAEYHVTYHGKVIARIGPVISEELDSIERGDIWAEWDALAEEISKHWPEGVSAVDAVRDVRREL